MHKRWFYRNDIGILDPYARRRAWEKHDAKKKEYRDLKKVTDWMYIYDNYTLDVAHTISTDVSWLEGSKKETKLALRQPLSMVPRDEIAGAIIKGNFSMVPMKETLPTPIKQKQIMLAA